MHNILEINDISKSFGGVQALDAVSFTIGRGEVHAIVGENGAGKSTLMNILAGVFPADSGTMRLQGKRYAPQDARAAREQGISIVFQELALFPTLSVVANIFVGQEIERDIRLNHAEMQQHTNETLKRMGVDLPTRSEVGDLTIGQQQWVEIARGLTHQAQILILDEPNSALNQHETEALFALVETLKQQGITIIYISHRLEEVFTIADRITVMRDGQYIDTWNTFETTISEIVAAMIGRQMSDLFERNAKATREPVLQISDLQLNGGTAPLTLKVHAGEVLGFAGLEGSGITTLFETVFGLHAVTNGRIQLDGRTINSRDPAAAIESDIAMVPADRRRLGLMLNWAIMDNIAFAVLDRLSQWGVLRHQQIRKVANEYVERLNVVTDSVNKEVVYLSGGNQQKVLLARWLATEPRVLLLEDPTRGIDVGAKQEIYHLIDRLAASGIAILFTSSEIEETLALSDRILVLRDGAIAAEIDQAHADKKLITEYVAGDIETARSLLNQRTETTIAVSSPSQPTHRQTTLSTAASDTRSASDLWLFLRRVYSIREVGVLQALLAVIIVFSLLTPHFLTISNLLLISRQMAIQGVIAAGMTFVLASGEVDLSVGWIFNMVMSVIAVTTLSLGVDPWLVLPLGLLVGTLLGALNGVAAVVLELPTIIITLGTLTLYRGLALAINGGRTVGDLPDSSFFELGAGTFLSVSYMSIVMLIVFVIAAWILRNTRFARHLLAMGSNRQAAQRVGVRTAQLRILVMAFSGLMCSIAGVLGLAFLGAADPQSGTGYELVAIAAAIIGGARLGGGAGTIWGTLIGIALIMAIQNGLVLLGLRPAWQIAATGLVIIAAVTVDYLTRSRRSVGVQRIPERR